MAGVIDAYLENLRQGLAYDPQLAERVCGEVAEHLRDLSESAGGSRAAELAAVARMGDPHVLVAGMARATLPARNRRIWRDVALAALAVFLAMRMRNMLLPVDPAAAGADLAVLVDRLAYFGALALGVVGWLIAWRGRIGQSSSSLAWCCTAALAVSGSAGLYLLVLSADRLHWSAALPIIATAVQIFVVAVALKALRDLSLQNRAAARR